ncbi:MAG: DUF4349 domain-containing protein [Armatimonadota bacterium]|nr:DUF4349 domain-containing protein [Armatimonadota bacterium]
MTHDDVRPRLSALIDGALDPREAAEVQAHLEACAACRADLAQLQATVAMLREVEPVQAPEGFAATVRARLENLSRAAGRPGWQRVKITWPRMPWSWRTAAAAAALALVGIFAVNLVREVVPQSEVTGHLEDGRFDREGFRRSAVAPAQSRDAVEPSAAPGALPRAAQPGGPPGEPVPLRRVIRTGQVAIEVETFDDAARRLLAIAEGAGGFIADSSYADEGGTPRGTFVLRVPAGRFADVLRQVEALGTVQRRQVSGQDVTEEFIDLEARVRNLERQETRLLTFMERATRIPDLLAIESELGRVRGEIERLTGRLRFLSHKVDLATITAEVSQKPKKAPGGFWDVNRTVARIEAAFLNTVRQLLGAAEGLAAFAAAVLPLVLLGALGWTVIRRSFRRADRPI